MKRAQFRGGAPRGLVGNGVLSGGFWESWFLLVLLRRRIFVFASLAFRCFAGGKETRELVCGWPVTCGGSGFVLWGGVPKWNVTDGLGSSVNCNCQL